MDRQSIIHEAQHAGQAATHNLKWMEKHPDRVNQRVAARNKAYLQLMQHYAREEKKNARRVGLTRFWTRIRSLTAIITKNWRSVNQKDGGTHESNVQ